MPDVIFDKITSITAHEPQQVYDLEIEGTHNFIANDIVAHNWVINVSVEATSGLIGYNDTITFTYNTLSSIFY